MNGFVPDWRGAFNVFGLTSLLILGVALFLLTVPEQISKWIKRRLP